MYVILLLHLLMKDEHSVTGRPCASGSMQGGRPRRPTSHSPNGILPRWIHAMLLEKNSRTSTVCIATTASVVLLFPALLEWRKVMQVMPFAEGLSSSVSRGPGV